MDLKNPGTTIYIVQETNQADQYFDNPDEALVAYQAPLIDNEKILIKKVVVFKKILKRVEEELPTTITIGG